MPDELLIDNLLTFFHGRSRDHGAKALHLDALSAGAGSRLGVTASQRRCARLRAMARIRPEHIDKTPDHDPGPEGEHAALSTGADHVAAGAVSIASSAACPSSAGTQIIIPDLRHSAPPAALDQSRPLRARPLCTGGRGAHPALSLHAVWRGTAHLHRDGLLP